VPGEDRRAPESGCSGRPAEEDNASWAESHCSQREIRLRDGHATVSGIPWSRTERADLACQGAVPEHQALPAARRFGGGVTCFRHGGAGDRGLSEDDDVAIKAADADLTTPGVGIDVNVGHDLRADYFEL